MSILIEKLCKIISEYFKGNSAQKEAYISKAKELEEKAENYKKTYSNRIDEEAVKESRNLEQEINKFVQEGSRSIIEFGEELKKEIKPKSNQDALRTLRMAFKSNGEYKTYTEAVKNLDYTLNDIEELVRKAVSVDNAYYGSFVSALINKIIKPGDVITLEPQTQMQALGKQLVQGKIIIKGNPGINIGHEMESGEIEIIVDAPNNTGTHMKGGKMMIHGKAGSAIGAGMKGGFIECMSEVKDHLGAGMNNGKIIVRGKTGNEAGASMGGGVIELMSDAGDEIGKGMRGGSIIVRGKAGKNVGAQGHDGVIELLGGYESIGATYSKNIQIHVG